LARTAAYFLKDLFGLMNRGYVLQLIANFISQIDPKNATSALVSIKFAVLKIVCSYEHFVPLCLPTAPEFTSVSSLMIDFWKRHFLVGLLLDELNSCLAGSEYSTRLKALTTLRDVLWKIDITPDYNHPDRKTRIANMLFPFLLIVYFFIFSFGFIYFVKINLDFFVVN
jgi:dedicator of cytokinesis protein 9/10/11